MNLHRSLAIPLLAGLLLTIAPAVRAETRELSTTLNGEDQSSYLSFIQQAEATATQMVQQGFADTATTEVAVKVLGERSGMIAPLLYLKVSRTNWQQQPQVQPWATYFRGSTVLLGFVQPSGRPVTRAATVTIANPNSESNYYDNR